MDVLQKCHTYHFHLPEFTSPDFAITPRDWRKDNLFRNKKKDPVGDPERKKKKNQKGGSGVNQEVCPP